MNSYTLFLCDPNELRAAAFAAFLGPWAERSQVDLHIATDPDQLADLPDPAMTACVFPVGGMSLNHPCVARTLSRLRGISPGSPLIVFSDVADNAEITAAIDAGLQGFIPTTMPASVAIAAIQFIINGGTYHPHSLAASPVPRVVGATSRIRHLDDHRAPAPEPVRLAPVDAGRARWGERDRTPVPASPLAQRCDALTKRRHIEVLEFLAKGETNKEIARHLNLTEATIKVYVRELMKHFSAKNRMQVALRASAFVQTETAMLPPDAGQPAPSARMALAKA
ncbi:response regulator transcription factor [Paracoccus nototheniae]|uniref:helix-turn-helix transcriptional regulator n=1 Tax=Paracoccus nototheniae TaxID=2489002 RepID=UPI0010398373|nr:response regulator transcription factor [Paracoccus nototheniae]